MSTEPFPFLSLPPELRVLVYERLPRTIKHVHVRIDDVPSQPRVDRSMTFVTRSILVAILRTCRLVHQESRAIVSQMVENFLLKDTPKSMWSSDFLCDISRFMDNLCLRWPLILEQYGDRFRGPTWYGMLNRQGATEGFLEWAGKSLQQWQYHRQNKRLYALQAVVKILPGPGFRRMPAEAFPPCERLLMNVKSFAIAGFIAPEDGFALKESVPSVYKDGDPNYRIRRHYHIRDGACSYDQMDAETWRNEWLI